MIVDGTINSSDIRDTTIIPTKIKDNTITSAKIQDGTILRADVSANFKAPYSDTADYARAAPAVDSARVSGNSHRLQGKDTTAFDARYVNEHQINSITSSMIVNGTIVGQDLNQMGASTGQVLKWIGYTWAPENDSSGMDNDWVRDTPDSVLYTIRPLGIARGGVGNMLHGNKRHTHVNLGVASTTGTSGQDYFCSTVGGGYQNIASGDVATIAGGRDNTASGNWAMVAGGSQNTASGFLATVSGGYLNTASGYNATVSGGYLNTASGSSAFVGGGYSDTASGSYTVVAGGYHNVALGYAATIGGERNRAESSYTTISGGRFNRTAANFAVIGGGLSNTGSGEYATVGGGYHNTASSYGATVAGGSQNTASYFATVAGGYADTAAGNYSFAVGYRSVVPSSYSNSAAFNGQTATASNQLCCGTLSKAGGSFTIDHPLDPYHKILNHYFVEGPETLNIYRGSVILDANGRAEVKLPDYFSALNRNAHIQLTGVGTSDVYVAEEIKGNTFVIGGKPGTKVYWQVTGERADVSAEVIRRLMPIEQPKTGALANRMLDDEFLSGCMEQLEREGKATGINFRTPEGRRRYEEMKNPRIEEMRR